MRDEAPEGPLQHVQAQPARGHAATRRVRDRHDGVDTGKIAGGAAARTHDDFAHDGRRAIDGGDDADAVARADPAVRPPEAPELTPLRQL